MLSAILAKLTGSDPTAPEPGIDLGRVLGPRRAPGLAPPATAGEAPEGHVMADVARAAALWSGEAAPDRAFVADTGVPSPEALAAAAEDLDLTVSYEERRLSAIGPETLPCVALMVSGGSRLLVARVADGFEVETPVGRRTLAEADLAAAHTGIVFRLAPKPTTARLAAIEPKRAPAPAGGTTTGKGLLVHILVHMASTQRRLLGQLVLAGVLSNLLMLALPLFTMSVYDRVIPHAAFETLWALALGVTIALGIDLAIRFVRLKLVDATAGAASVTLQANLYRRLVTARPNEAPRTPGAAAQIARDVDSMSQIAPQLAVGLFADVPFFIVVLVLLWSLGGPVVIAPILGVVMLAGIYALSHKGAHEAASESGATVRQQTNVMAETIGALDTVKATGAELKLLARWERLADASVHSGHLVRLWTGFASQGAVFVTQFVIVVVVMISVYEIAAGVMTVGSLAACTLLVGRAIGPIGQLVSLFERIVNLGRASEGALQLLSIPTETAGDATRPARLSLAGRIEFANVVFAYPGEPDPVLKGVSLRIEPGEKVGLIGKVGSGKSTILRLLARLAEPGSGQITIDGHDIRQFGPRELRRAIGVMRQDPVLMEDTLKANLGLGLDSVDAADFETAVSVSGVKDFALRHPKGYALPVGPRGERLSGGERQAVALARTLMSRPDVLVLDEPTAAMDNTTEARLVRDLKAHVGARTLIVATHRAAVLALVDRIVWLDQGRVVADGPKDEVLRKLSGQAA